jgi:hypothetical protein
MPSEQTLNNPSDTSTTDNDTAILFIATLYSFQIAITDTNQLISELTSTRKENGPIFLYADVW